MKWGQRPNITTKDTLSALITQEITKNLGTFVPGTGDRDQYTYFL